ncbi:MAG TPA: DUF2079 domain-containing protein, partial [Polyangiaceae bacterium]
MVAHTTEGQGSGASLAPNPRPVSYEHSWVELTLCLFVLGVAGASLVFATTQAAMTLEGLSSFLQKNLLGTRDRNWLVVSVLGAAALPALGAGLVLLRRGRSAGAAIWRATWLSSPLALAWAVPSLLSYRIWYDNPTPYLIFLAAFVLVAERVLRQFLLVFPESLIDRTQRLKAMLPARVRSAIPLGIAALAGAGYAAFTAYYSLQQHARLATAGYDLGIYDNLIFSNLHGRFFHCPVLRPGLSFLSNHAEFGTIMIAPIYALRPGADTLLVLQALALGSAAIPLYLFASTQISRTAAAMIAVSCMLFAPLHGASFYDFHWVPMTVPLWFWLFYALAKRSKWAIILLTLLLLPIREDTGVMLAVLGAFLIVTGYWQRVGLIFIVVGVIWFGTMRFVVMPLAGSWWFDNMYADLIPPGDQGFAGVIKTLLTNP